MSANQSLLRVGSKEELCSEVSLTSPLSHLQSLAVDMDSIRSHMCTDAG